MSRGGSPVQPLRDHRNEDSNQGETFPKQTNE